MPMMTTLVERHKAKRRRIAELVLAQHKLRNEMDDLLKIIGRAQNAVDLGTEVAPLAHSDLEWAKQEWQTKLHRFEHNEILKVNARMDALKLKYEMHTT